MIITDVQTIVLKIRGEIVGQPRHRNDPRSGRAYTPKVIHKDDFGGEHDVLGPWRDAIYLQALGKVRTPWKGPVVVNSIFYFARPEYMDGKKYGEKALPHTAKYDRDNLDKVVLDVLSAGKKPKFGKKRSRDDCPHAGIFHDDAQVYGGSLWKLYAARGEPEGARIEIILQTLGDGAEQLTLAGEGKA